MTHRMRVCTAAAAMSAMAFLLSAEVASAAPPNAATVRIKVKRSGETRSLQVVPRGVGVCNTARDDCDAAVTWKTGSGSNLPKDHEYLTIVYDSTVPNSEPCFGAASFRLDRDSRAISSGPVQSECPLPTVWFYKVQLWDTNGTPDPGDDEMVVEVDPAVIIEDGR